MYEVHKIYFKNEYIFLFSGKHRSINILCSHPFNYRGLCNVQFLQIDPFTKTRQLFMVKRCFSYCNFIKTYGRWLYGYLKNRINETMNKLGKVKLIVWLCWILIRLLHRCSWIDMTVLLNKNLTTRQFIVVPMILFIHIDDGFIFAPYRLLNIPDK